MENICDKLREAYGEKQKKCYLRLENIVEIQDKQGNTVDKCYTVYLHVFIPCQELFQETGCVYWIIFIKFVNFVDLTFLSEYCKL